MDLGLQLARDVRLLLVLTSSNKSSLHCREALLESRLLLPLRPASLPF